MSPETWIAFVVASIVMLLIPGPTVLLVVSYALGHGRRAALASVVGVAMGDFVAMTASLLGLGVLLATSATLFTVIKWIGAAYLVYLGIKLWRAPVSAGEVKADVRPVSARRMTAHMFLVTVLNPKSIVFFVAFLPQFLDAARPLLPQFAVMEATFLVLAAANAFGYAMLASGARGLIRKPAVQRAVNRTGGSLLIGAGVMTAAMRKAA